MKSLDMMSKKELETEFNAYEQSINDVGCYGVRDMVHLTNIYKEIDKRGYKIRRGKYILEER